MKSIHKVILSITLSFFLVSNICLAEPKNIGLYNYQDKNCFFNATIQCLSYLDALNEFININKQSLKDYSLGQLNDVYSKMKEAKQKKITVTIVHIHFIDYFEKKFHNIETAELLINSIFKDIPPELIQSILNFAFIKEERIYEILQDNKPSIFTSDFIFGNYPKLNSLCGVQSSGQDFLSQDKFTKENTPKYDIGQNCKIQTFITKTYNKKITLDLIKIKEEIIATIEATYAPKNKDGVLCIGPLTKQLPKNYPEKDIAKLNKKNIEENINLFIEDLKEENIWNTLGISPKEAAKIFLLTDNPNTTIFLTRKLIPPMILILAENNPRLNDYLEIKKEYLPNQLNVNNIKYELKSILVGNTDINKPQHAWAYAKDKQITIYDDDVAKYIDPWISSFKDLNPNLMKSKNLEGLDGSPVLLFYELEPTSKPLVENFYRNYKWEAEPEAQGYPQPTPQPIPHPEPQVAPKTQLLQQNLGKLKTSLKQLKAKLSILNNKLTLLKAKL